MLSIHDNQINYNGFNIAEYSDKVLSIKDTPKSINRKLYVVKIPRVLFEIHDIGNIKNIYVDYRGCTRYAKGTYVLPDNIIETVKKQIKKINNEFVLIPLSDFKTLNH